MLFIQFQEKASEHIRNLLEGGPLQRVQKYWLVLVVVENHLLHLLNIPTKLLHVNACHDVEVGYAPEYRNLLKPVNELCTKFCTKFCIQIYTKREALLRLSSSQKSMPLHTRCGAIHQQMSSSTTACTECEKERKKWSAQKAPHVLCGVCFEAYLLMQCSD